MCSGGSTKPADAVFEELGNSDPTKERCDEACTLTVYIRIDHDMVKVVPVVGVLYTIYSHNVTLGTIYCVLGLTTVVSEDGVEAESTIDNAYTYLVTAWPIPNIPGVNCATPTVDSTTVRGSFDG